MSHEWHHLMMLKRAGCSHEDLGVKGTWPGALAVLCPACPHLGINLPNGWESALNSEQYVMTGILFAWSLMIDLYFCIDFMLLPMPIFT
jgi:hypothetical protein